MTETESKPILSNAAGIPGGNYTAERTASGKWNVYDVPIFAEIPKGERGNRERIDHEWMLLALSAAQKRLKGNYLPPLHVYHNDYLDRPIPAGQFRLRRVGKVMTDEGEVAGLFADLVNIPDSIFSQMERGELPYRSVEVFDWSSPEINELALLPSETPFFRFEMLTIGEKVEAGAERVSDTGLFRAYRKAGKSGAYLFRFKGGTKMAEDKKMPEDMPKMEPAPAAPAPEAPAETEPKHEEPESGSMLKQILEAVTGQAQALKALVAILSQGKPSDPGAEVVPPPVAPEKKAEGADMSGKEDVVALKATVHSLAANLAKRDAADAKRDRVAAALAKLAGWHISADLKADIEAFADEPASLDRLVALVQKNVPKDDPDADEPDGALGAKKYPAEVMAYAADPNLLEAADRCFRDWKVADEHGVAGMNAARWIEMNIGKAPGKK